jgi:hypothetical protein
MSFGIYIVGYIILIVGLATGAHLNARTPEVDRGWHCLFDWSCDHPWGGGDPTKGSAAQVVISVPSVEP